LWRGHHSASAYVVANPKTEVHTSIANLGQPSGMDASEQGNGTYGDGNLWDVGYTG
jgi:hypothetical protein